jgi:hypothetical protein
MRNRGKKRTASLFLPRPEERKVFLSHAYRDPNLKPLSVHLKTLGLIPVELPEKSRKGKDLRKEVLAHIDDSVIFVSLVSSKASLGSQWLHQELGYAVARERLSLGRQGKVKVKLIPMVAGGASKSAKGMYPYLVQVRFPQGRVETKFDELDRELSDHVSFLRNRVIRNSNACGEIKAIAPDAIFHKWEDAQGRLSQFPIYNAGTCPVCKKIVDVKFYVGKKSKPTTGATILASKKRVGSLIYEVNHSSGGAGKDIVFFS